MRRFKLIVPSFIAIIFCMLLIAGSTFALFTSQAEASIAVTSGKVKITANLTEQQLYSAKAVELAEYNAAAASDNAGQITEGNYAGNYVFDKQTGTNPTFVNSGTAELSEDGSSLVLERMTPGDKIVTTLDIDNQSNVNIKYRVLMNATYKVGATDYNQALASVLEFTFGETTYAGLVSYRSAWHELAATDADPAALDIIIEFPLEAGNDFQEGGVVYNFTVEAVQANAATSGEETYETISLYVPEFKSEKTAVSNEQSSNMTASVENAIVEQNSEEKSNLTVKAVVPASSEFLQKDEDGNLVSMDDVTSTQLKVSDLFISNDSTTNETTIAADVKLIDQDNNEINKTSSAVNVEVYVGKGFSDVKVYHKDQLVSGSIYNPVTGYVSFETDSFSPFKFVGDFEALIGTTYYGSLADAAKEAKAGEKIYLLKDVNLKTTIGTFNETNEYFGFYEGSLANEVILTKDVEITFNNTNINLTEGGKITLNGHSLTLTSQAFGTGILYCQELKDDENNPSGYTVNGNSAKVSVDLVYTAPNLFGNCLAINSNGTWDCRDVLESGPHIDARSMTNKIHLKDQFILETPDSANLSVELVNGATYTWYTSSGDFEDMILDLTYDANNATVSVKQSPWFNDIERYLFCDVYSQDGNLERYYWVITIPTSDDWDF